MAHRGRHLAPRIRRISRTWVVPLTLVMTLVLGGVAWADNLEDTLVAGGSGTTIAMEEGQNFSTTISYEVNNTGNNHIQAFPATVSFSLEAVGSSSVPSWASLSALSLSFSDYDAAETLTVSGTAPTGSAGTYQFRVEPSTSVTHLNPTPGRVQFSITVTPPAAPSDTQAPQNASIEIDDGAAWTNSAIGSVSLDLTGTDNVGITRYRLAQSEAGLGTATDVAVSPAQASFEALNVPFTLTGSEATSKSVWLRVYDAAGSSRDASDTIGWDSTPPNVAYTSASGTGGTSPWYISNVVATFTATDTVSGFGATGSPTTTGTATSSGEGSAVTVQSPAFTDNAGNTRAAGAVSQSFSIDLSNPAVAITSPADEHTTIAPSITVSGTVSDAISGVASVDVNGGAATLGTGTSAGTFSKSSVALACGANSINATATDNAGRTNTSSITVNRTCFSGIQFYQPLDQTTPTSAVMINSGKYGRVIPVKVTFSVDGSGRVTQETLDANGWSVQIGVNGVSCAGGAATDTVEAYADAGTANSGTSSFRWDATSQQWIYNLDTKAPPSLTMAINSCYRLDVYVSDGTDKVKVSTTTYAIFKPVK